MSPNIAALLYLVSGILFILALRGLSNPETARQGNYFGMAGMAIAIITSFLAVDLGFGAFGLILIFMVIGGAVGAYIARQIKMTAMPQLVAAFHSLVGMSAVLVAVAALYRPDAFGITGADGHFHLSSLIELSLGSAIGAITFSGSVIAFAKLNGNMSGAPITFKGQHWINLGIGIAIAVFIVFLSASAGDLKAAFMEGCRETAAADAKTDESATLPSNFCQCAFDELSDEKTGVDFDELMEINEELTNADGPGKLPAEVTKVFADCGK